MSDRLDLGSIRRVLAQREPRRIDASDPSLRRAAVATVLRPASAEPEVLLIKRAEHPGDPWSGHMAFPGGREDPLDPDLYRTAVRETQEEVGLDLERHAARLGRLDDVPAIARGRPVGLVITPFVFEIDETPPLVPNEEVAEVLWAPLGPLARGEVETTRPYVHEGRTYDMPAFDVSGRIVWGLTYQMLQSFFRALREDDG